MDPSKTTATTATAIQDLGRSRGNASEGAVDSCLNSPPQPNAAPAPGPQASATQASLITQYPTQVQNKATCDNQLSTPQGPFIPRGPWNGTWLQFQISVPANYDATLGTYPGYWYLHYNTGFVAGGNQAEDVLSAVVGFNGTAVHLIP